MPPLYQDPLSAVPGAWSWVDLARVLVEVSCEGWVVALVALAVYSFLEAEVKGVLKVFLPLALALLAAGAVAFLARAVGGLPGRWRALATRSGRSCGGPFRPRRSPRWRSSPPTRRSSTAGAPSPSSPRRRSWASPTPSPARTGRQSRGRGDVGVALGIAAYGLTLRLAPDGHVARRRPRRRPAAAPARPGSP